MKQGLLSVIRDCHTRRGRERRGLILAEGVRLVEEALAAGVVVRGAVVAPQLEATPRGSALKASLAAAGVPVEVVDDAALAELAATEQPQGVVAVVEPVAWPESALVPAARRPLLVLDAVQDPGNVGTMLRTALALGCAGVVALPGTAEVHNPKAVRASMGAIFRLPTASMALEVLLGRLAPGGARLWAAEAGGESIRGAAIAAEPVALAVGNEGGGLSAEVLAAAVRRVAVPLAAGAESLNVAAAAAILLWELAHADG